MTKNTISKPYNIGFALSGGFIKGFAHLGVMQALLENDIKPEILSGVSAGALAGALYADGNEPYKVVELFEGHTFQDLTKLVLPKAGLFELTDFIDFLKSKLKSKKIEDLPIPLVITATDFDNGKCVHFRKGSLAEHVAASCCMPVLFKPLRIGSTHYVDGGIFMNLPVHPIRKECEKIVGINVSPLEADEYKMNIVSIAVRSYMFLFRANSFAARDASDLLIEPVHLGGYNIRGLDKAGEIFEHGYKTATETLKVLRETNGSIWSAKPVLEVK